MSTHRTRSKTHYYNHSYANSRVHSPAVVHSHTLQTYGPSRAHAAWRRRRSARALLARLHGDELTISRHELASTAGEHVLGEELLPSCRRAAVCATGAGAAVASALARTPGSDAPGPASAIETRRQVRGSPHDKRGASPSMPACSTASVQAPQKILQLAPNRARSCMSTSDAGQRPGGPCATPRGRSRQMAASAAVAPAATSLEPVESCMNNEAGLGLSVLGNFRWFVK